MMDGGVAERDYSDIIFEDIIYREDENNGDIYDCIHLVKVGKWNNDRDDIIWSNEVAKVAHECIKDEHDDRSLRVSGEGVHGSSAAISQENLGYIYAMTNECMPGLVKIGRTDRNPELRAKELFTTGVPVPFELVMAKRVKDPIEKEKRLHHIMRHHEVDDKLRKREFFRADLDMVLMLFGLIDGEIWPKGTVDDDSDQGDLEYQQEDSLEETHGRRTRGPKRKMKDAFNEGQEIRHILKGGGPGYGQHHHAIYKPDNNMIVCTTPSEPLHGESYKSLSAFALAHAKIYRPDAQPATFSGWVCTEKYDGENWISV